MRVKIEKSTAHGKINAPPSKSMAHRLLIASAMCDGESHISGISSCEDVLATIDCLRALGVNIDYAADTVTVRGNNMLCAQPNASLHCRESGSTLRFLIPVALLSGNEVRLTGAERLIERPHEIYEDICRERRLIFKKDGGGITVKGPLKCGEYRLPGNVSSQFITGLLFALPLLSGDSKIVLTTKVESRSYIELTLSAIRSFGIRVDWLDGQTLFIPGNQKYQPQDIEVEGDYSGAAFIESLKMFGAGIEICGLREDSLQGDRVYREHFKALDLGAPTINIEDCPDLGPILFTVAAAKHGAIFEGTKRLKIKESDRAAAMAEELSKFGAKLILEDNKVTVLPSELHEPTEPLSGHNDHRIVMSLAILASLYGGEIHGAEAVKKSYPEFFRDIKTIGIKFICHEI